MAAKKSFIDRLSDRFEALDTGSRQAYILRLARDRGFFETVFNAVDEGIMVLDRNLKIRYSNRAARELLALPENFSEVRVSQLLQGIDWQRILQEDEEEWSRLTRQEIEILYPERRFVQFYLVPLPEEDGLAVALIRDVTESREHTMSEMERETVRAVSLLAAGVAHEIGNPLNSLYLNLQIMERSMADDAAEDEKLPQSEIQEMIKACKGEVERLDSIINGFLSAIRPGRPSFAPVDIREIIVDVLTFMRPEIEARQITVNCDWENSLPKVSGDASQLKQAFYNIIRNAVQAMTNGGTLAIYGYGKEEYCIAEFADTGSGITPEALGTMFNAFRTNRSGGNGIGTMIIERICREHGAEFGLETSPGRGTVFQVRFPVGRKRLRMLPPPEGSDK